MIGTVISADMDLIGQMQPNTLVRFAPVDMPQALSARREANERLAALRRSLV
jgi:allophanate hydrolase subunit 2